MVDVQPTAGTVVLFKSREMLHEVCPSHRRRWALSIWFEQEEEHGDAVGEEREGGQMEMATAGELKEKDENQEAPPSSLEDWRWPAAKKWFACVRHHAGTGSAAAQAAARGLRDTAILEEQQKVHHRHRNTSDERAPTATHSHTKLAKTDALKMPRDARKRADDEHNQLTEKDSVGTGGIKASQTGARPLRPPKWAGLVFAVAAVLAVLWRMVRRRSRIARVI